MIDDDLLQEEYDKGYAEAEWKFREELVFAFAKAMRNITVQSEGNRLYYQLELNVGDLSPVSGFMQEVIVKHNTVASAMDKYLYGRSVRDAENHQLEVKTLSEKLTGAI